TPSAPVTTLDPLPPRLRQRRLDAGQRRPALGARPPSAPMQDDEQDERDEDDHRPERAEHGNLLGGVRPATIDLESSGRPRPPEEIGSTNRLFLANQISFLARLRTVGSMAKNTAEWPPRTTGIVAKEGSMRSRCM